jgi:serine-type D-Ala-D-Ala carboxypeptidase (penicillin-binding protein 5/6)
MRSIAARHAVVLLVVGFTLTGNPISADQNPTPPKFNAKAWLLIDHDSDEVLADHQADLALPPASLTKLMVAYLLFERVQAGTLKLNTTVEVSTNAWKARGSRIFLPPESKASVEMLIKGMIVRSANDATIALVEHVAGTERSFVELMNKKAQALGMPDTVFANATGLSHPGHRSTARDLSRISSRLIRDFPNLYGWFAIKEFGHNSLTHYNRNALLWRDPSVDGVKTGRTQSAGYCLIASAKRERMRLIATVLGAYDENGRVEAGQQLLEYGFRHFETRLLYAARDAATRVRVWMGEDDVLPLGMTQNVYLTLPRGWHNRLQARLTVKAKQIAPIHYGQRIGTLVLDLDAKPLAEYPLVALREVRTGNLFQRAFDSIRLWLQ